MLSLNPAIIARHYFFIINGYWTEGEAYIL